MNNKEKDILALFNELNSMLYEVMGDCNKALSENIELKKEVAWFKKYTDALVEHKDMVCLPADLKNLRESNAALATENQELKNQLNECTVPVNVPINAPTTVPYNPWQTPYNPAPIWYSTHHKNSTPTALTSDNKS